MEEKSIERMLDDFLIYFPVFYQKVISSKDFHNKQTSASYYQILGVLMHQESLPISVIGDILYISRPNMTSYIDKLVKDGMVERIPDEKDRRIIRIKLTPGGREFIKKSRVIVEGNMRENLSSLNAEELENLSEAIKTVKLTLMKIEEKYNEFQHKH
ncbi:MarR family winged helix-turn-helix transcriptional regulator [Methanobacterium ferruginis]|uniref:MarR family winged helix-turn-helix transcriptional regulator n=1 Tax=Methanobacterium ferruginis TaxID=710191 RepID=UPI0025748BCE|nr:MarR family transcriptional regulator [Methanobacterium ferruginis]MCC7550785.1 MarR family transcriptional regulator [Methanobacterium sp.]BDZ67746.1 MarR family transcriptional regulator [Methanobacterium ferruginis]